MRKLSEWHHETYNISLLESLPTIPTATPGAPPSGFGRTWMDLKNKFTGKPAVDWDAVDKQQQQAQQQQAIKGTKDDPEVQNQKYETLKTLFHNGIFNLIPKGKTSDGKPMSALKTKGATMVDEALTNLAASFTLNKPIRMTDIEQILIAVNQYSSGRSLKMDQLRSHQFLNHATILRMLQDIFSGDKRVWYDPEAHSTQEQYPPRSTFNPQELKAAMTQWESSPYKYVPKMPIGSTNPQAQGKQRPHNPQDQTEPGHKGSNYVGTQFDYDGHDLNGGDSDDDDKDFRIGDLMMQTYSHMVGRVDYDTLLDMAKGLAMRLEKEGHQVIYNRQEMDKIMAMARTPRQRR